MAQEQENPEPVRPTHSLLQKVALVIAIIVSPGLTLLDWYGLLA